MPVLTAHPTEVRRSSTIRREMEIAELLARGDRFDATPEEERARNESLRAAILISGRPVCCGGTVSR
jgi:phosphoenolpyruvate carboxylase